MTVALTAFLVFFGMWFAAAAIAIPTRVIIAAVARDGATIARILCAVAIGIGFAASWLLPHPSLPLATQMAFIACVGVAAAIATVALRGRAGGPLLLILVETLSACIVTASLVEIAVAEHGRHGFGLAQDLVFHVPSAFQIFVTALPVALVGSVVFRAIMRRWKPQPGLNDRTLVVSAVVLFVAVAVLAELFEKVSLSFCCP